MTRQGGRGLALVVAMLCVVLGLAAPAAAASPPTIASFTPTSGPLATRVTITGTNFTSPATVKFNGVASGSVVVNSATSIAASVPNAASTGRITVTTSGGTATSTASFTVTPGVARAPATGPPGSTETVAFSGFSPYEAVDVYFDTTDVKLASANSTGAATVTLAIPASASPGVHYISVVGRKSGYSAQIAFTVRTDWTQYGFDSGHTNDNPYEATVGEGNVKKLARVWRASVQTQANYGYNQVVVAGGIIYTGNDSGVIATSESTGAQVWAQVLGQVIGTPAVSGSTVLVGTTAGHLIALNAATGAIKYNFGFSGEQFYRPITVAGTMGFTEIDSTSGSNAEILAFDVSSGAQDWTYPINGDNCEGVSVSNGVVYTVCTNEHLYALTASNGSLVFNTDGSANETGALPVVANGLVFCDGFNQNADTDELLAYDADTGALVWAEPSPIESTEFNPLTVADDEVFEQGEDDGNGNSEVSAFATTDGTQLWTVPSPQSQEYSMTAANGLLYVAGNSNTRVLDVTTGARVTQVRGGQFAIVTDAGLINALYGTALMRYALPTSAYPAARKPAAATLRPNYSLKARA